MSRRLFQVSFIVFMIMFLGIPAFADDLEGKTFKGQEGLFGKEASGVDEVFFKDGKFISNGCIEWGFSGGDYTTTADGENVHFVADTYSAKYGRIIWTGTVKGNHLDATYIWFDKGKYSKPEQVKWFSGNVK
jgi:hypothetical protein